MLKRKILNEIERLAFLTGKSFQNILIKFSLSTAQIYQWKKQIKLGRMERKITLNPFSATEKEEEKVIKYRKLNEENHELGYKKLTWSMIDNNIVHLTESAVYKILKKNRLLGPVFKENSTAKKEYEQKPEYVHHHWHTDIAYVKIRNVFYYFIFMLDGYSRYILHWKLLTDMTGLSTEIFLQETIDKYPGVKPMVIHDNGTQFTSLDFKRILSENEYINIPIRVRHPESNGKAERFVGLTRQEALRPNSPAYYEEGERVIRKFIDKYNNQRLHAGIKYLTPSIVFNGFAEKILNERKNKLSVARKKRYEENKLLQLKHTA